MHGSIQLLFSMAAFTSWTAHQDIAASKAFIQHTIDRHQEEPGTLHLVWAILPKGERDIIGTISFNQDSPSSGHIDYALGRKYWGQGLVTEAVKALVPWVFAKYPQIQNLKSGCLSDNIGSVRVLEKAGFQVQEKYTKKRGGKFGGQLLETTTFALSRNTWASASRSQD